MPSAATFVRRAGEAVLERKEQVAAFVEFNASLPSETTVEWTVMVKAWENDVTQPNPFDSKDCCKFIFRDPGAWTKI